MNTRNLLIGFAAMSLFVACKGNDNQFDATGTFEATEVIVSSEATGRILRLDITEGDILKAGVPVGNIDSMQLYLKKLQLQTNSKAVESRKQNIAKQIAATKEQIAVQKREQKRFEKLLSSNAANRKQLDDIESQIAILEKQLAAQISSLESKNASVSGESSALDIQVAQIEDNLTKCYINSPISGTVLTKYAEAGEFTTNGKPLFKVADMENMILRAYITADQLTKLKQGQQVAVFSDFGDKAKREYKGYVNWISDKAEFTPKTIQTRNERANQVYAVKIFVKNDGYLKIGMYGELKF